MEKIYSYIVRYHNLNEPANYDFKVSVTKRYIKQYAKLMRENMILYILLKLIEQFRILKTV